MLSFKSNSSGVCQFVLICHGVVLMEIYRSVLVCLVNCSSRYAIASFRAFRLGGLREVKFLLVHKIIFLINYMLMS